ncbi:MAG: SIS domain-containing protein [Deltaproteobacteria bacterium]|jgi:glucosamine--fructose-6-phosphate aminotransferase (isomerizing)|nr:SIS domain-containing protein [Deltaproteobacteria bacterium]
MADNKVIRETPFFLKEINEQPKALANTLAQYLGPNLQLKMNRPPLDDLNLKKITKAYFTACGTSYHAALTARYMVEELARIPAIVEPASECGRHYQLIDENTLAVAISQSGRSRETLTSLQLAASKGASTLAVVNECPSPLTLAAQGSLTTLAGRVNSLSSTKAFTCQSLILGLLGLRLAQIRGADREQWRQAFDKLSRLPELVRHALSVEEKIENVASKLINYSHCFILARGRMLPMACEGALKLKEVARIHAEGSFIGEFGHGPLALVSSQTPIIVIAFADEIEPTDLALAFEFKARNVPVFLITENGPNQENALAALADEVLTVPAAPFRLRPIVTVIPLQFLAYHLGRLKGLDADRPGGLISPETYSDLKAQSLNSPTGSNLQS